MSGLRYLLLCCICCLAGKPAAAEQQTPPGNAYAVVIGISKYENASLATLKFADRDATLFAEHLKSKAGGHVPEKNIRLLLNEEADIAAIYVALNWLRERCGPNDRAYFYFSGHGDVETENKFSLGFLLAYNSPPNNYRNNAIAIEDLNTVANDLSSKSHATVVLVTDACHSGKLAGDYYKGKQLVASQLQLILDKEIRLAACGVNEEAAESEDWGGGRGVFSYYLLQGLKGVADLNRNDTIQLRELQRYLDSSFTADKILIRNAHKQRPVLDGNLDQIMAITQASPPISLNAMPASKARRPEQSVLQLFEPLRAQPIDYLFTLMKTKAIESKLHFSGYSKISADSLPLKIVDDCTAYQKQLSANTDTLQLLKNQFLRSGALTRNFNERFIQMVHGQAQDMINAYLEGDLDELGKRQYFSGEKHYEDFINMLRVALRICPADHFLYQLLAVQEAYLSGLLVRLQMVTAPDLSKLLPGAFAYQQKAIQLEPYAAYIHNELGNLYMLRKKYALADRHFDIASELSPTWAIPWGNKIRVGLATGNIKNAVEAARIADSLQHNLPYSFVNAGMAMEKQGNLLAAESYFKKAIHADARHFLPYERLGHIYTATGDFDQADWYLTEAALRKQGLSINMDNYVHGIASNQSPAGPPTKWLNCDFFLDARGAVSKPYIQLIQAVLLIEDNPVAATQDLRLAAVTNVPLREHYLGKALYNQQKWEEAEPVLRQAIASYKADSALSAYLLAHLPIANEADTCLLVRLMDLQYNPLEDRYMLAKVYKRLGLASKALPQYETIMAIENENQKDQAAFRGIYAHEKNRMFLGIREASKFGDETIINKYSTPPAMGGYLNVAGIYERSGDYLSAEKIYLRQIQLNHEAADMRAAVKKPGPFQVSASPGNYRVDACRLTEAVTYDFYQRMLRLFPRNAQWQERAGLFLYKRLFLALRAVPPVKFHVAYDILNKDPYPFVTKTTPGIPLSNAVGVRWPGMEEMIMLPLPIYDPVSVSLECLKQAIRLSGDVDPKPQLLLAVADLNSWMGNRDAAFETYKQVVATQECDTSTRRRIIDYAFSIQETDFAIEQLEILYRRGETTRTQNLALANAYALSDRTDKALTILKNLKAENPDQETEQANLLAQTSELAGNKTNALAYLNAAPIDTTHDWAGRNFRVANRSYAIARLLASQRRNEQALDALNKAFKAGFAYQALLQTDPAWNRLRKSKQWKALLARYPLQPRVAEEMEATIEWYGTLKQMTSD